MSDDSELFSDVPEQPRDTPIVTPFDEMTQAERDAMQARWRTPRKRSGKARTPENAVRAHIEQWLKRAGILYRRVNSGMLRDDAGNVIKLSDPGTSDYLCEITIPVGEMLIGVFCAIEVKAPGNTPTLLQTKFLNAVKARGGIAIVAYNALDVETAINEYRNQLIKALRRQAG